MDIKELLPGDSWKYKIEQGIEKADFVLIFLSKNSVGKTGYVQHEVKYALEQRELRPHGARYIIPILLEDCEPPRQLHNTQWLNYWESNAYSKLLAALNA